jgi:hypothetical protein
MQSVAGFPYWEIQFTEDGQPDSADRQRLLDELPAQDPTDLFVISHGWRNDVEDARSLYAQLLANMRARLDNAGGAGGRRFAVAAVLWPSLKFGQKDELPHASAAATAAMDSSLDVPPGVLQEKLRELGQSVGKEGEPELERVIEAAGQLGTGPLPDGSDAREAFVQSLRNLLPPPSDTKDDASDQLFAGDCRDLFDNLEEPLNIVDSEEGGGAASMGLGPDRAEADPRGEAAGLASMFNGVRAAAWRILNYATYYLMKERAAKVGNGLNLVLADVRGRCPSLRIHLIGHSFGARLVTAAAAGPSPFEPSSLSLLQGAYSHNALGPGSLLDHVPQGFFRKIMSEARVKGPIIATHTHNDKAVGVAYAIASRLSGDKASDFGGPNDVFGGIGRNGAVRMRQGEVVAARLENGSFNYPQWPEGKVTNLLADAFVSGHGDVTNPAVANAVLNAARA